MVSDIKLVSESGNDCQVVRDGVCDLLSDGDCESVRDKDCKLVRDCKVGQ